MPKTRDGYHYVRSHYRKNPGPPQPRWIAVSRTTRKVLQSSFFEGDANLGVWSARYSDAKLYLLRDLRKIFKIEVGQEQNAPVIFLRVL